MNLTTRISAVLLATVIFTAAISSGLILWRFDAQLVNAKLDDLQRETEIQATRFEDQINELMRDVQVVSGTSPVQGIIRATGNGGIDPRDGSSLAQLSHRLAVNFRETLSHKPSYVQMRFIGVADEGKELVRVDRHGANGAIRIVAGDQLQSKDDSAYFQHTITREPGSVYLSPINLNREYGKIQTPRTPVIRAAIPVRSKSGEVFGLIVINYGLRAVFRALGTVANPGHHYYLSNGNAEYLLHPDTDTAFDFEFGEPHLATTDYPLLTQVLDAKNKQTSRATQTPAQVVSVRRVSYGPPDLNRRLGIIVTDSYTDITQVTREVIQQIGLLILVLLIMGLLAALWLARLTTRPIMLVTESVREVDKENPHWQRPSDLSTEAEELAGALESAFNSIKQRSSELDKKNRELQQFAYIASHDLQEPVRTISSFANLLNSEYNEVLDDRAKKYMRFLVESSERMRLLIHGLLEFSRLGKDSVPEKIDLNITLADIQQDMFATIDASSAVLHIAPMPTLNLFAVEIRLLFQNLISNAIKFMPPERTPVVSIDCESHSGHWTFSVTDNGLGIAPEQRDKVFLIFQRLHGRSSFAGSGIGLAHCRKVVELHNGQIWIEDAPSGGSTFCFTLKEISPNDETRQSTSG